MAELQTMERQLTEVTNAREPQFWTGDFNSLTKEDYSEEIWKNVTEVRKQNQWELPKTEARFYK